MTIERTIHGGYRLSTLRKGCYYHKLYLGYTRAEAIEEFREYVRAEQRRYIVEQR